VSIEAGLLRKVPGVDRVLAASTTLIDTFGRDAVTHAVRTTLDDLRHAIRSGSTAEVPSIDALGTRVAALLSAADQRSLRAVYNLTGTILHTNLGRAVLPRAISERIDDILYSPANVEFDIAEGGRGERDDHLESLICELTGAEGATVVNNNAAALLLVLNTLAHDREVPVSRGELVEIGGSFRIPEVMARAGCQIAEIGTTNRTHAKDYRGAISDRTALLLKVHPSNYEIAGFTKSVSDVEVADIAREHNLPFVNDLGSGSLVDLKRWGLPHETTVAEAIEAGANLVTFSGDKLLGGPQAGFIVGDRALVAAVRANPMKRALRVDKITIAILAEVLRLYRNPDQLAQTLPTLRHLTRATSEIEALANTLAERIGARLPGVTVRAASCTSQIGSGSLPVDLLPSHALELIPEREGEAHLQRVRQHLLQLPRPIIGRIQSGTLVLDLRTVDDPEGLLANILADPSP